MLGLYKKKKPWDDRRPQTMSAGSAGSAGSPGRAGCASTPHVEILVEESFAKAQHAYAVNKTKHIHEQNHAAAAAAGGNTNGFNMYVKEHGHDHADLREAAKQWQSEKGVHLNF